MPGTGMNNLLELSICVNTFDNLSELSAKALVESRRSSYLAKGHLV